MTSIALSYVQSILLISIPLVFLIPTALVLRRHPDMNIRLAVPSIFRVWLDCITIAGCIAILYAVGHYVFGWW